MLEALSSIGFKEVETAGFGKYTAKDFRKFSDDAGLRKSSAHLPLQNAPDVALLFAEANTLGAQYATSSYLVDLFGPDKQIPDRPLKFMPAIRRHQARFRGAGSAVYAFATRLCRSQLQVPEDPWVSPDV